MSSPIEEAIGTRLLPRIVLIACGSFSPPTLMHLRMFEIARDYFKIQGTHKVVGGIISPTHDAYGKSGLVPGKHRCSMIERALKTSSWIRLSDWEILQDGWSCTKSVLEYHQNYMNNYINTPEEKIECKPGWLPSNLRESRARIEIKLLCGADLLESFAVPNLWTTNDVEAIVANHGLVVISRSGTNPEKFIFDSDVLTRHQRNIQLVTNWIPNEVSSTMIRRLLSRGQSIKYLIDDLVIEYIQKQRLFSYQSLNMSEDTKACFFNCNRTDSLVTVGVDRLRKIAESSIERGDTIHTQIEHALQDGSSKVGGDTIHRQIEDGLQDESLKFLQFDKVCVSSYTSKDHIKRAAKKKSEQQFQTTSSSEPKRSRRSYDRF